MFSEPIEEFDVKHPPGVIDGPILSLKSSIKLADLIDNTVQNNAELSSAVNDLIDSYNALAEKNNLQLYDRKI